jgi:subtilisin family serine protease
MKFKKCFLLLAVIPLLPFSAPAFLMRESGPEPIIIQIKESLRQSDDLDSELAKLASLERESSVTVEKRWAGAKYLELISFPRNFTEKQALAVVAKLQQLPSVEKVVALSAFNLEFRSGDFSREFAGNQPIPEVARRGFDRDRIAGSGRGSRNPFGMIFSSHAPDRIIVRWKDEYLWKAAQTGFTQTMASLHQASGCRVIREERWSETGLTQVLQFDPSNDTVLGKLRAYLTSDYIDFAQPDYIYELASTPNDPIYNSFPGPQWSLAKISAPQAWDLSTGDATGAVIIAIGDTGANVGHPEFLTNLWSGQNNGEIHNWYANSTNVADDNGHGSNVASIIGAKGNNGVGMTGIAWNVSLMHLKIFGPTGGTRTPTSFSSDVSSAIDYARTRGALAMNCSFRQYTLDGSGNSIYDQGVFDAIRRAKTNGMLIIAAAGNETINNDNNGSRSTPPSIPTDNVISVAATDPNDNLTSYSNYGRYRVDLAAPGGGTTSSSVAIVGLKQTWNGNSFDSANYSYYAGTSQAAPHVSGAAALVKSLFPWEGYLGIRDRILMGIDDIPSFNGAVCRMNGRLNLFKALQKRTMMRNLSTRARVENGDRRMIGGFYIGGSGTLKVAIRGLGPSLPPLGVARLNNPQLTLNNGAGQQVFFNDDWNNLPQGQKDDLASVGLTPIDGREAAMVVTLNAGAYTVFVDSQDGQYGVGSFEIYEMEGNTNEQTRLVNVSTRCLVGIGDEVAIAGTILGDASQSTNKRRILMFGKGPSLPGLSGVLTNPQIEARNSAGSLIASNDDWRTIDDDSGSGNALEEKLTEAGFAPSQNAESVLWPNLQPGSFTTILKGVNNSTGIGLVEFFEY